MPADLISAVPWWVWAIGLNVVGSVGVYRDLCTQTQARAEAPARPPVDVPSREMQPGGAR